MFSTGPADTVKFQVRVSGLGVGVVAADTSGLKGIDTRLGVGPVYGMAIGAGDDVDGVVGVGGGSTGGVRAGGESLSGCHGEVFLR